jgi:GDP-D-mannose 3',5'-epimerase
VKERGLDASVYSQSTIVKTSAPTELGTLRKADGDEGFAPTAAPAIKA